MAYVLAAIDHSRTCIVTCKQSIRIIQVQTDNHVEAFPLHWPDGRPRVRVRHDAPFRMTLAGARDHLLEQIRLLGGRRPILSSNLELRIDGLPYANQRQPNDSGIAVYFEYKKKQHCFACDDWSRVEDNIRAIGKTIEALRGIARWGTGDMMERAFQGFIALPSPAAVPWYIVLGFHSEQSALERGFEGAAKVLMQRYHPDRESGDEQAFKRISKARDDGRTARQDSLANVIGA